MKEVHDKIVIIGSGPAGLTAAIYAARAALPPLVIEGLVRGGPPGGQLIITTEVENYPGFPKGILGPELMELFREQAERFGTKFLAGDVDAVDLSQAARSRIDVDGIEDDRVTADALIIATGASAKWLGMPSEKKLEGYGVSRLRDLRRLLLHGTATCSSWAAATPRWKRRPSSPASPARSRSSTGARSSAPRRSCSSAPWRTPRSSSCCNAVDRGDPRRARQRRRDRRALRDTLQDRRGHASCRRTGVFVAIGHQPNSEAVQGPARHGRGGYLSPARPGATDTKIPGVFACGDVADHVYRQAVTAAGTGCMAAIDAERFLAH